jgi:hypothetical protein
MMRSFFALGFSFALALASTTVRADPTPTPEPDPARAEAEARYSRATRLYEEGNYEAALAEFRRAYTITHEHRVLYNIAQLCYRTKDYVCSVEAFESYLVEGGDRISAERRAEVNGYVAELLPRIGTLRVEVDAGAEVVVDDVPRGHAPLDRPIRLSAGQHHVRVLKTGKIPETRTVEVVGAAAASLRIDLVDALPQEAPATARPLPPPAEAHAASPWTTSSWVGLGAAGVLAGGATVTGVMAVHASNTLADTSYAGPPSADAMSQQSRVKTLRTTTDVLAGAAIVTLGVTLYFTLRTPTNARPSASAAPKAGSLGLAVSASGVLVRGDF